MDAKPLEVAVVGSTFGSYYMRAVKFLEPDFHLAGLVARGSKESVECARAFGIPLYKNVAELPKSIDVVCVTVRTTVTGGSGTAIVMDCLNRGFSVLVEAPMHFRDLSECFQLAKEKGVAFKMGDMYSNLSVPKTMIETAAEIRKDHKRPVYINFKTSVQVYLNGIRFLLKCLPDTEAIEVKETIDQGPFTVIAAKLLPENIHITIELNDEMMPGIPDAYFHLLHALEVYYPGGRLTMTDTYGAAIWHNRMHLGPEFMKEGYKNLTGTGTVADAHSYRVLSECKEAGEVYNLRRMYQWPRAIAEELSILKQMMDGDRTLFLTENKQDIHAATIWSKLTTDAGYPKIRTDIPCEYYEPGMALGEDYEDEEI